MPGHRLSWSCPFRLVFIAISGLIKKQVFEAGNNVILGAASWPSTASSGLLEVCFFTGATCLLVHPAPAWLNPSLIFLGGLVTIIFPVPWHPSPDTVSFSGGARFRDQARQRHRQVRDASGPRHRHLPPVARQRWPLIASEVRRSGCLHHLEGYLRSRLDHAFPHRGHVRLGWRPCGVADAHDLLGACLDLSHDLLGRHFLCGDDARAGVQHLLPPVLRRLGSRFEAFSAFSWLSMLVGTGFRASRCAGQALRCFEMLSSHSSRGLMLPGITLIFGAYTLWDVPRMDIKSMRLRNCENSGSTSTRCQVGPSFPALCASEAGLNAAAVGLLVPTMFVVYDTLQERSPWQSGSRALVVLAYYFIELMKVPDDSL